MTYNKATKPRPYQIDNVRYVNGKFVNQSEESKKRVAKAVIRNERFILRNRKDIKDFIRIPIEKRSRISMVSRRNSVILVRLLSKIVK